MEYRETSATLLPFYATIRGGPPSLNPGSSTVQRAEDRFRSKTFSFNSFADAAERAHDAVVDLGAVAGVLDFGV